MDIDEESEWDIQSIRRYEKLLMFESEYLIRQMELFGSDSGLVCLGNKAKQDSSMLTVYTLPSKLKLLDNKQAPLRPDFDLKISAGVFTKSCMNEIACMRNADYLFGSEEGAEEVIVYRLDTNSSDKLMMSGTLKCEGIINPKLSAASDYIVASSSSACGISFIDIRNKAELNRRDWEGKSSACLRSVILSAHLVMIHSTEDGQAFLYDTRQQRSTGCSIDCGDIRGCWTAGGSYEEGTNISSNIVGFLSNQGTCRFYNLANTSQLYSQINLGSSLESNGRTENGRASSTVILQAPRIRLNPLKENLASVSGLDSRIYVLDVLEKATNIIFTHDGHEHMESCPGADTRTTSHLHYTPGGKTCLISSADNWSINCWSYNNV